MKRLLQIIDRIGEWMILSFLWSFTSILTLGVGMGVGVIALQLTLWRSPQDHQGYVVRNYLGHVKAQFKWSIILATTIPFLLIAISGILIQFLLSQPPSIVALILMIAQVFITMYLLMLYFHLGHLVVQHRILIFTDVLIAPLKHPLASILYLVSAVMLVLAPIYLSFALVFITVPLLFEIHVWIGKKVVIA
jgi:hypothetical protein